MRIIKLSFIVMSVLALSACSTLHKGSATGASGAVAGSSGAVTQGLGQQSGFAGQDLATRQKLMAPRDQVYHFAFDSDVLSKLDAASAKAQANYLVAHPGARLRLEGNTDERGSREYNVALGWRRAKAVAQILKLQGVNNKQIVVLSYGEEKPVAYCHNDSCWRQNRRVSLVYEAK
ncbi:MAG: peptidoglycan-associated lipoprotein Pal [Gammaproteobacteria bacterium]|nr:peptidoglycan-associated lipoprotein Pal [Gammaproteobacteria bacterium]